MDAEVACIDCDLAAQRPHHGFTAGCIRCKARAAARSPHFARVRESGVQDRRYRELLAYFELTHDQVKDAAWLDASANQPLLLEPYVQQPQGEFTPGVPCP